MRASAGVVPVIVVSLLAVAACSDDEVVDPSQPIAQEVLDVSAGAAGGSCMLVEDDFPAEVEELPMIECEQSHTHEVYATVDYAESDVYPGLGELEAFAQTACLTEFDEFVGISAFDSSLSFSWLLPTLDGWNEEDDRAVLCVLQDADGTRLVGTMRQSKRT